MKKFIQWLAKVFNANIIVEKIVEVPTIIEKVVEKPVEKIVEKIVYVEKPSNEQSTATNADSDKTQFKPTDSDGVTPKEKPSLPVSDEPVVKKVKRNKKAKKEG